MYAVGWGVVSVEKRLMDVFREMDSVKAEKAKAIRRYRRFRQIAGVFRCVEFFVGFLLLAWLSLRLPLVLKLSGEFLRQLAAVVVSPLFVFLVGNAIVITLFANSRHFSGGAGDQLYDEFVKSSEGRGAAPAEAPPEVVEDKTGCEEGRARSARKEFRRSKSEAAPAPAERMQRLRRSETDAAGRGRPPSYSEAEMSDEEFNRAIEQFIAKQLKFQREESMAVVPHGHKPHSAP